MVKFNTDEYKMEEILVGRWEEDDSDYFINDNMFGEGIWVNKATGNVYNFGFNGLTYDYINKGYFIIV